MKTGIRPLALFAVMFIVTVTTSNGADYNGTLRVYMTETESRWMDSTGAPYNNALLDFAVVSPISILDNSVYTNTIVWNSTTRSYGDLEDTNYAAVAVLFGQDFVVKDAWAPYGYWFNAHYADAAAQAAPGSSGVNLVSPGYTHTVFIEEGTAQW